MTNVTIAYNSAYDQTETLNFTFTWQTTMTLPLHGMLQTSILLYYNCLLHFCIFLLNPNFDLEPMSQKANKMTLPAISCLYGNIVNFSHTSQIHFSANIMSFCPFKQRGCKCWKIPETAPSPWVIWTSI